MSIQNTITFHMNGTFFVYHMDGFTKNGLFAPDDSIIIAIRNNSMQSYGEKLEIAINFIVETQRLDKNAAHETAIKILLKLSAWKSQNNKEVK